MTVQVAFLEHGEYDVPGVLAQRADELGFVSETYRADHGAPALPPLGSFDLLVVMGSRESATDRSVGWIAHERRLVTEAVATGIPVLGVCFGGQLLAHVLGGEVSRASQDRNRMDLSRLRRHDPGAARPWLVWHEDAFTAPPGADVVARTDVSDHAYILGIHTGVQFHPEVTEAIVLHWVNEARAEDRIRPSEAEGLLAGFDDDGRGPDDQTRRLFDGYVERAGFCL